MSVIRNRKALPPVAKYFSSALQARDEAGITPGAVICYLNYSSHLCEAGGFVFIKQKWYQRLRDVLTCQGDSSNKFREDDETSHRASKSMLSVRLFLRIKGLTNADMGVPSACAFVSSGCYNELPWWWLMSNKY